MLNKSFVIMLAFIAFTGYQVSLASGASLSLDKTPNENLKMKNNANAAMVNMEKTVQELLAEAKKTNELLQKLIDSNNSSRR